jgi:hypothetical protein
MNQIITLKLKQQLPELRSNFDICKAYASQSFLLKLNTIVGAMLRSIIILTILKQLDSFFGPPLCPLAPPLEPSSA